MSGAVGATEAIEGLDVGACYARAERFAFQKALQPDHIKHAIANLRNTISKQAQRVAARTGNVYTISQGTFHTVDLDLIGCIIVTRTA